MKAMDIVKAPLWAAAVATGAKSFRDNGIIGSPRLNRLGLHGKRVEIAHAMAWSRRRRLEVGVDAADRAAFDLDGFVVKSNVLPADQFAQLAAGVLKHRALAREMVQGDTITRRMALDRRALLVLPQVRALLQRPDLRNLMRYVASFDAEPLHYVQTILSHVRDGKADPQTHLHADTFHPSLKAWLFLTDVALDEGPFCYVPGSHRLTPERLTWEHETSIKAAEATDKYAAKGSFRLATGDLAAMGLPPVRAFAVKANTLVVADTVGFHARGESVRPTRRLELWSYSRRNPFLPWTGLDPLSLPGIVDRRIPALWYGLDTMEWLGLRRSPWRDVGYKQPLDDPGLN
jgi:Phytanoyl-CoA dioxygenase (PhyH)